MRCIWRYNNSYVEVVKPDKLRDPHDTKSRIWLASNVCLALCLFLFLTISNIIDYFSNFVSKNCHTFDVKSRKTLQAASSGPFWMVSNDKASIFVLYTLKTSEFTSVLCFLPNYRQGVCKLRLSIKTSIVKQKAIG